MTDSRKFTFLTGLAATLLLTTSASAFAVTSANDEPFTDGYTTRFPAIVNVAVNDDAVQPDAVDVADADEDDVSDEDEDEAETADADEEADGLDEDEDDDDLVEVDDEEDLDDDEDEMADDDEETGDDLDLAEDDTDDDAAIAGVPADGATTGGTTDDLVLAGTVDAESDDTPEADTDEDETGAGTAIEDDEAYGDDEEFADDADDTEVPDVYAEDDEDDDVEEDELFEVVSKSGCDAQVCGELTLRDEDDDEITMSDVRFSDEFLTMSGPGSANFGLVHIGCHVRGYFEESTMADGTVHYAFIVEEVV